MNDTERKALVEELAATIDKALVPINQYLPVFAREDAATACLPIIERLLAAGTAPEPGLDELLDSVHEAADIEFLVWDVESGFAGDDRHEGEWVARIVWPLGPRWEPLSDFGSADGTGPTRTDAMRHAVAQATGTTQEGTSDE